MMAVNLWKVGELQWSMYFAAARSKWAFVRMQENQALRGDFDMYFMTLSTSINSVSTSF